MIKMTAHYFTQNILWLALAMVSGGLLLVGLLRNRGLSLSVGEATLLMNREEPLLLDVRDTGEWSSGHLPAARHISLAQLKDRLSEIETYKSRPVIVYCGAGHRSLTACATLKKAGFTQVRSLAGGLSAWRDAGLPLSTGRGG
jgi:rhodanese-related sulfurtransferase